MRVKVTKRFIAGAVCPKCGEMDRVVMYVENDRQFRECVSCGFHDEMRLNYAGPELETRVNRSEQERQQEIKVVKLLDPGKQDADG